MSPGWGDAVGWIFDRLPSKKEGLRKRIEKLEREMDDIQRKATYSDSDRTRYQLLSGKLRQAQDALKAI